MKNKNKDKTQSKLTKEEEDSVKSWIDMMSSTTTSDIKFDSNSNSLLINDNNSNNSNSAIIGHNTAITSGYNLGIDWSDQNNTNHSTIHTTPGNGNYSSGFTYNPNFQLDSDDLVINIEKLFTFKPNKREVLQEIIRSFINESDHNIKKMLLNTLESYSLITDKKTLERKVKIIGVLDDEDNETGN